MQTIHPVLRQRLRQRPQVRNLRIATLTAASGVPFVVHGSWTLALMDYTGEIVIAGEAYPIRPGLACLLPPGVERIYHVDEPVTHRLAHFAWGAGHDQCFLFDTGPSLPALCAALAIAVISVTFGESLVITVNLVALFTAFTAR